MNNRKLRLYISFVLIFFTFVLSWGQTHPGADPVGMSTPVDGGILMAILSLGGLATLYFKKNRNKKKDE